MKKMVMLALGIMAVSAMVVPMADAQPGFAVDKGNIMIGGTAGFNMSSGDLYENADGDGSNQISIAPAGVFFVMPCLGVGAELSFSRASVGDNSATSYGIGPKVMYAFGKKEASMYPYVSASFAYMSEDYGDDMKRTGTTIKFGGGLVLLPAAQQHLGVNVEASYNLDSKEWDEEGAEAFDGSRIMLGVGLVGFLK